ncbi:chemoreceptor glutamine deamidase CheD [Niveibacterium umoris]|uniref:Probable chemoreceptor glutamine deamidase CheD n=1 Tax=Niveibacterium umoris TaxID=1193620 RepID=A0A840BM75_9RHOO|nr:chemotaxis protein CheD [Niveibacterium umoris]MBB4014315.1 chemotaxis protein CheD [Niveibacterium umoris]
MSRRIFINPGGVYFGEGDERIETLLGSCVAVTIWHPAYRIGGMCHFLLPRRPVDVRLRLAAPDGRYGTDAIQALLDHARRRGTPIGDYTVKIFGGGRVLDLEPHHGSVGDQNARFVMHQIESLGLIASAVDLTGDGYRYLRFELSSGDVWVKRGQGVMGGRRSAARPETGRVG